VLHHSRVGHNQVRRGTHHRGIGAAWVVALLATSVVLVITADPARAGPPAVVFGFVPLPANEFRQALLNVDEGAGATIDFAVGITNVGDGAVIYYDHWEDGFEADISNPVQASTEVWGDGIASNGNAAFNRCRTDCSGDRLTAGDVFVLRNNVPTPRTGAILFDGRDKVASTRGFAITGGGYPTNIGAELAGVVSSFDTSRYGTDYLVPVGEDTPFPTEGTAIPETSDPFGTSSLLIMAAEDATTVRVDADANGTYETTRSVDEGAVVFIDGGVLQGAHVIADKPVQVHEGTGDPSAPPGQYENRWFTLYPTPLLSGDYVNPVAVDHVGYQAVAYFYNPNPTAIVIVPTCTSGCTGVITVAPRSVSYYKPPRDMAVRYRNLVGRPFIAVTGIGAQSGIDFGDFDNSPWYDWGFALIPTDQLTTQVILGFAPGNAATPPSSASSSSRDSDPVWVTALAPTTIRVDYDGDPTTGAIATPDCFGARHDSDIAVGAYGATKIHHTTDWDMTGARIYTCNGVPIMGAWGQSPDDTGPLSPGFDAGYAVMPFTTMVGDKSVELAVDGDGDGRVGPGDTIQYDIAVSNAGNTPFTRLNTEDALPPGVTYVAGSSHYVLEGSTAIPDDAVPPAVTAFPFDEGGAPLPNVNPGSTVHARYQVRVDNPYRETGLVLTNTACTTAAETSTCDTVSTQLASSDLSLTKTVVGTPPALAGDTAVFRLALANAGPDPAAAVAVTDLLPAGATYLSSTPSQGAYNAGTGVWSVPNVGAGGTATLDITARITSSLTNVAQVTASGSTDPDSQPAEDPLGPGATNPPDQDDEAAAAATVTTSADLSLTKTRTTGPDATGTTTFTVAVNNAGPSDATGVAVTDIPPAGSTFVGATPSTGTFDGATGVWTVGTVATGATLTLTLTYRVTTFPSTNYAQVTASGVADPDSVPAEGPLGPANPPDQDDEAGADIVAAADLSLTKLLTTAPASVGDVATFTVTVANGGPAPATDVAVADLLPPGLAYVSSTPSQGTYTAGTGAWSVGTIAGSASATLTVQARVTATGAHVNTAQVSASGVADPDSTPGNSAGTEDDQASVTVTTTGGTLGDTVWLDADRDGARDAGEPGLPAVGVSARWIGGDGTAGTTDDLTFTGATDATGTWSLTGLPPGAYDVVVDPVTLPAGVAVPTFDRDGLATPNTAAVALPTGGTVTDVDFGYVGAGSIGDTIFNDLDQSGGPGAGEGLAGVRVTATWFGRDGVTGTADDVMFAAVTDGSGIYAITGLPPGSHRVAVDTATLPAGMLNRVDPDAVNDGASTVVLAAGAAVTDQDYGYVTPQVDLTVAKSDGNVTATPGSTVTYTITYGNSAAATLPATGVVLTETVPANTTFNPAASTPGWSCLGVTCTHPVAALAVGASRSVAFAVTVATPVPAGVSTLSNTVTIAGDAANGPDSNPANNTATEPTPVTAGPDLSVVNADGDVTTAPGSTVVYTVNYANTGNQTATGVVLTETVPANTTFNAAASTAGWSCAGATCTYAVGAAAVGGAAPLTFAVTVAAALPPGVAVISNTVSVADDGTNGPEPTPANNADTEPTPVAATPDLSITKTDGDVTTAPGSTVGYTLTYTNTGNQAATGVVLTETVPANTTFNAGASTTGWNCPTTTCTLAVGAVAGGGGTGTATFAVTVDAPLPAGVTTITNTASVADNGLNGADPTPVNNTDTEPTPVTAAPDLSVTKTDGDVTTAPGSTVGYTLTYTNTGNQAATGVVLTETVPANATFNAATSTVGWSCAATTCTLAVGAVAGGGGTATATFAVTVSSPIGPGITAITNTVTVADDGANGPDPTPADNTGTDTTPLTAAPDLTVTQTDDVATAAPGSTISYSISYSNVGDQFAGGVVLTETVPAHTTFVAAGSSPGWVCVSGTCTLPVGELTGRAAASAVFTVVVDAPLPAGVDAIANTVSVADDGTNGPDPTPANNTATEPTPVTAAPDLSVTKADDAPSADPGATIGYTIGYANSGNQAATAVALTEVVPADTTFDSTASDARWTCAAGTCTLALGDLAPGATGSVRFAVTVADSLPAGVEVVTNTVTVADDGTNGPDPTPADNTATETTLVAATSDLSVTKTDGGVTAAPGSTITYTVSYANTGNQAATGVVLVESVLAHTTFDAATSTPGWSCSADTCVLPVGTLAAGASGTATFALLVDTPLPAGVGDVTNTVSVTDDGANGADPTPADNTATEPTPVAATSDLSVVKSDGGVTANPGSTVVYTLAYANTGDQAATGVVLTETIPADTTFTAAGSSPGWVCVDDACAYPIGPLAAGASGTATFVVTLASPLPGGVTELTNTAAIADDGANGPDEAPIDNIDSETTPVSAATDLSVTKTDGDATAVPGAPLTYTITYANRATATIAATGVVLTETIPANTTFAAGASDARWVCVAGTCTLAVGTVAVGASGSVAFAVTVDTPLPGGVTGIANVVSIADDGTHGPDPTPDDNTANEVAPVAGTADLLVTKTDGDATATPGSTVAYTIAYANSAAATIAATGVVLTETVPAHTTFAAGASDARWMCVAGSCTLAVGTVAAGASGSVSFAVTVDNPLASGVAEVVNTVSIADDGVNGADPSPADNTATEATPVTGTSDLSVTKTDGGVTAIPGSFLSYTITYGNTGNQNATGVVLTETVPIHTSFDPVRSSPGWACTDGTCHVLLGAVAAGGTAALTFVVDVDPTVPAGVSDLTNNVVITSDGANGPDPTPADNAASETTPLAATSDLSVAKSDAGVTATPGSTIVYTLSYASTGDQAATGVVLTETVPAYTTFAPAASDPLWVCTDGTCELPLGALTPAAAGTVLFAVTVDPVLATGVTDIANSVIIADDGANGPDPTPADNTATDPTPVTAAPDLSVTKTDGGVTTTPGSSVAYTVSYRNDGNQAATGVVLTETVPAYTTFDGPASTAGWACVAGTCTLPVEAVAGGGGSGSAIFAVTVDPALPAGVTTVANTVSVGDDGANGTDGDPADNLGSDTTVVTAAPDLSVTKTDGGASVGPGATINYTVTYRNAGNQAATGVVLTETVPADTTFNAVAAAMGWFCVARTCTLPVGTVGAGQSGAATFAVTVVSPLPAGVTTIANSVSVADDGANGPDPTPADNVGTDTTPVAAAPDLVVTKADGDVTATPGSTVPYTLTYGNVGNQAATAVVLTETVPVNATFDPAVSTAGWSCVATTCTYPVGDLAVGVTATVTFAVTVASPLPAGVTAISNTVTAGDDGANGPDPVPANNVDSEPTPVTATPDLAVTKTDGDTTAAPGAAVAYTLTYTNSGTQAATGVVLTEVVPDYTTFDAAGSAAGWACAGATCTLAVGTVAGGGGTGTAVFAVTVDAPLPGGVVALVNTASVADDATNGPDPTPADNTGGDGTPVEATPDLSVTKTDGGVSATPGSSIAYTVAYANTGDQDATGVVLTETLPANTTFDGDASTPGWVCTAGTCTDAVGTVGAGGSGSVTFAVTVAVALPAGVDVIANTVSVADDGTNGIDPTPADNTGTDTTPVTAAPDLSVTKTDGIGTTAPGSAIAYTIDHANGGDQAATGVVLTETVPANTTFDPTTSTAGWACAGVTCTFAVGTVAAGGSGSVTFAVVVSPSLPAGVTTVANTVTVADDGTNGPDGDGADNTGTDTTAVAAAPDLSVTKTDGDATAVPGGRVAYTLGYANTGNQAATGVVLTETVPANTTFDGPASTPGWACPTATCTLTIPTLAAGASGTVVFAVTVASPLPSGVATVSNSVSVADDGTNGADPTPPNNTATDTTPVTAAPDLSLVKSDGGATAVPGATVTYTLDYANTGDQAATGVVLSETVPANTTFNAGASTPGWACAGTACTLAIDDLGVGGAGTADLVVNVDSPLPAGVTELANTATVADDGANGADPAPADNTATDTTPVTAAPDLTLTKSDGGTTAVPGATVAYTLVYANRGDQAASGVVLTETVPANTTFAAGASTAGWNCAAPTCTFTVGTVAGGFAGTGGVIFAVTVDAPLPAGVTGIANIAVVADDGTNGADPTPADNTGVDATPVTAAPDLSVTKTDADATATAGSTVVYVVSYTNAGNQVATGVVLTETVPANTTFAAGASDGRWSCTGDSCTLAVGSIVPGATGSATFAATVATPLPAGATAVVNTVTIADDGTNGADPVPTDNTATEPTPVTAAPDLAVLKSDGGATATPGSVIPYVISVANSGDQTATAVVITETVPVNTTFDAAASTFGWTCTAATCTFPIGDLAPSAFGSGVFAVRVDTPLPAGVTDIANTVTIADDGTNGSDLNPVDNTATDTTPVSAAPDLSVTKSDGGATAVPGATVSYTISYANAGDQTATGVVLTETVPAHTTYNAGASMPGWFCAAGTCTMTVGTVAPGASGTAAIAFTVASPLPAGVTDIANTVTVADDAANGADPTPGDNTGTDTTPVTAAPDLSVTKTDGGAAAAPGSMVSYTISYGNTGNQDATGVVLTEAVPANTTFAAGASTAGWTCVAGSCTFPVGAVAAGGSGSVTFAVTVASPLPAGVVEIANTVTVADDITNGTDPTPADNTGTETTPVTAGPDLSVTKSDGGVTAGPGSTVAYTLSYANTGDQAATGVVLTETVPASTTFAAGASTAGWTCTAGTCTLALGTLAGGASGTATFAVTVVSPLPAGVAVIANTVTIADDGANGVDPTPADNTGADSTPAAAAPDLSVTKSDGGATTTPGATVAYTITYANTGDQAATGVILTETVPADTSFAAGASSAGWTCLAGTCTNLVGPVAAGGTGTATFAVTVDATLPPGVTDIANLVTIGDDGSNGVDPTPADNTGTDSTPATAAPDLTVTKSDAGVTATPGDTIGYTIGFANAGDQAATGVVLTETVPAHTTFAVATSTAGWTCAAGTCTFAVGTVAAGGSGSVVFAVTVDSPLPAGVVEITNTVAAADDGANGPDGAPADNTVAEPTPVTAAPDLSVTKSDGGILATPGATVPYTLSYANTGDQAATGVVLTETVPVNTTFDAGASDVGWSCAAGTCTLPLGTVAAGGSGAVVFAVTVATPLPAGATGISNTATVADDGANGPDPTPANNTGADTTPVTAAPDLTVTKTDGDATALPGSTIVYTLSYGNTGDVASTGVVLTETVPASTTFDAGASTAGWSCLSGTCTLVLGEVVAGASGTALFAVTVDAPLPAGVGSIANTVTVADDGTNGPDATPADNAGADSTPVTAAPDLSVTKSDGGATATPGSTVAYTLSYANAGDQAATGVVLTETVPASSTFDAPASDSRWTCPTATCTLVLGTLDAGVSGTATFAVTVASPLPAGVTGITNTATVADDITNGTDPTPADNTGTDTTPVTAAPDLSVTKSDGDATAVPGATVAYTITYANNGDQAATGVVLTETVPADTTFNATASTPGWTCTGGPCTLAVGVVAGGTSGSVVFAVTVDTPVPAGVTGITNTVTVADDGTNGPDGNSADNTATEPTPVSAAPDLSVTKTDRDVTAVPGDTVSYTISYANRGDQAATGVVLTETIPANTTYNAGASMPGWSCTAGTCTMTLGTVAAGATGTAVIAFTVVSPLPAGVTVIANTVTVADDGANGTDPTPADNTGTDTTPVTAAPDLSVTKSDGGGVATPGSTVVYTITYANAGDQAATGVVLTETVPANTSFAAGASMAGWTCAAGTCTFPVGTVVGGGSGSVTFAVTVDSPLPAGITTVANSVTMADDGGNGPDTDPGDNTGTDTTPVTAAPDLSVAKSDGGATATPGSTVAYTLSYANAGTQAATGVVLIETVPANTTFAAGASTPGWSCAAGTCTLAVGDLAAGASGTATFVVTVVSPLPAGVTGIANTVTVADDGTNGPDPTPGDTTGIDATPVTAAPDLSVAKSDGGATATPGSTVAYTLSYANAGDQAATGVVLTETVPPNTAFAAGASTAGWACPTTTCTLAVGTLAAGASGTATFAVTVVSPLPAGVSDIANTVTVADDGLNGPDATPADNTGADATPVTAAPDLLVTKSDGGATAVPDATVAYTIGYANAGDQAASGVTLTETVPANTTFAAGASTAGWTCPTATCTFPVGNLAPGAPGAVTFAVTVDSPVPAGLTTVANTVTVADDGTNGTDPTPANNTATDTTPVTAAPDLSVTKSDGGGAATPGATVTYTIAYANSGVQAATGVVLTETVPANTTFAAAASDVRWTCVARTCTLPVGSVGGGTSGTAPFAVTVDSPLPAGVTTIANTVTVTDDGTNGIDANPTDNTGTAATPVPVGAIGDAVVLDLDGDGVGAPGEPGVAGATVNLLADGDGDGAYEIAVGSAVTDGAGSYRFDALAPARYRVALVVPTGFATSSPAQIDHALGLSEVFEGADFAVLGATIGDRVWQDSDGNGRQDAGEPGRPGATVTLIDAGGTAVATTTTAADGTYAFRGRPAGGYTVAFPVPAGALITAPNAGGDDGLDSDADALTGRTDPFTVAAGESRADVDGGFYDATTLSGSVYADADDDGVRDTGDLGISGATVTLTGTDDLGTAVTVVQATDADGRYAFDSLRTGVYTLAETQPAGYFDGSDSVGLQGGTPGDDRVTGIAPVAGRPGSGYDFGELAPAVLTGGVLNDLDGDATLDATEPLIAGVTVTLTGIDNRRVVVTRTVVTDGTGFRFDGLRPGTYTLTESQPAGYLDGADRAGTAGGVTGNDTISSIVIGAGTSSERYGFAELQPATISGRVWLDGDASTTEDPGEPGQPGVTVTLGEDGDGDGIPETVVATTTTDATGAYAFLTVAPGAYVIAATIPPGLTATTPASASVVVLGGQSITEADVGLVAGVVDLAASKELVGAAVVGSPATWRITVTNAGTVTPAGPLTVTDTLPAGTTYAGTTTPDWTCSAAGQAVTCTRPDPPAPGSSVVLELVVNVIAPAGTALSNTAVATVRSVEAELGNNTGEATAVVVTAAVPDTTIAVAASEVGAGAGDEGTGAASGLPVTGWSATGLLLGLTLIGAGVVVLVGRGRRRRT
jgi:uncharacterized repeat protein (TIGR01451 family)